MKPTRPPSYPLRYSNPGKYVNVTVKSLISSKPMCKDGNPRGKIVRLKALMSDQE